MPGLKRELTPGAALERRIESLGRSFPDYRIPGPFTSMPFSIIFSCSTFGETSNASARLMNSFWMK
jgi:hypothetical protein